MGKEINAKVVDVINGTTIVIGKGSDDNVAKDQRYLVYSLGKEILDPDTKESLGVLELVGGEAIVVNVQNKIATLKSDLFKSSPRRIMRRGMGMGLLPFGHNTEEEIGEQCIMIPFDGVAVGHLVRQIS